MAKCIPISSIGSLASLHLSVLSNAVGKDAFCAMLRSFDNLLSKHLCTQQELIDESTAVITDTRARTQRAVAELRQYLVHLTTAYDPLGDHVPDLARLVCVFRARVHSMLLQWTPLRRIR